MDRPDFHELAEHELNEAAQYYDLEEPGLGSAFLDEVERCLQSIAEHREAGAILQGAIRRPRSQIPVCASIQDQPDWHPDSGRDESAATADVLDRSRMIKRSPRLLAAGFAGG
jgi:hypothetical protein